MTNRPEVLPSPDFGDVEQTRLTLPAEFDGLVAGPQIRNNISLAVNMHNLEAYSLLDFVLMPRKVISSLGTQGYEFSDIVTKAKPFVEQLVGTTAVLGSLHVYGKRVSFLMAELEEESAKKFEGVVQDLYNHFSLRSTIGNTRPHIVLGRTDNRNDAWAALRELTRYEPSIVGAKIIYRPPSK